jgi:dTDP-4-amino-4,6-dideoxygalactose transaminase
MPPSDPIYSRAGCGHPAVPKIFRQYIDGKKDIPTVSYYSVPLSHHPVFENLSHKEGGFPVAEKIASKCLSMPMSPYHKLEDQKSIIDTLKDA